MIVKDLHDCLTVSKSTGTAFGGAQQGQSQSQEFSVDKGDELLSETIMLYPIIA